MNDAERRQQLLFMKSNEALIRHLEKRTVAIVSFDGDTPSEIGSGTCIKIEGRYLVATAAHVISKVSVGDIVLVPTGGPNPVSHRPRVIGRGTSGGELNDDVDVGWLEIHPDDVQMLRKDFDPPDRIVSGIQHLPDDLALLCGYPGELIPKDLLERKFLGVQPVGYYTTTIGTSNWPLPSKQEFDIYLDYNTQDAVSTDGEKIKMPDAPGFSGGGIWAAHANVQKDTIWSPSAASLIAIDRSWFKEKQWARGTQIQHWLRLIDQDLPMLSSSIANIPH